MFWKTAAWFWNQDDQDSGIWLDAKIWKTSDSKKDQTKISTSETTKQSRTKSAASPSGTRHGATESQDRSNSSLTQVHISRGEEGFGFTIFCDSPVRVQSVDVGGPAGLSGLQQGDVILHLNGLLVDSWSSTDLARTIRSCLSQVHLVVQRGTCDQLLRPGYEDGGFGTSVNSLMTYGRCQTLPRTFRCWSKAPSSGQHGCCSTITPLPANYATMPTNSLCFIQARPPSLPDTYSLHKWDRRPRPLSLNCLPNSAPFSSSPTHTSWGEGPSPGPSSTTTEQQVALSDRSSHVSCRDSICGVTTGNEP